MSKNNYILLIIWNYKFRPISGYPQVQNWPINIPLKNIHYVRPYKTQLQLLQIIRNL